jgi:tetratricopeptide (TPR) repeat protein
LSAFDKAAGLRPDATSPLTQFWRGFAARAAGDQQKAMHAWRAADAGQYFLTCGSIEFRKRDYVQALVMYDTATMLTPSSPTAWLDRAATEMNLASVGLVGWDQMLYSSERALNLRPEDPQAHFLVGYALWLSNRNVTRAEQEFRWALARRNYWGDAYALGRLLLDSGRAGEPTALMSKALSLYDEAEIRAQLIRAYLAEGRCSEARQLYGEALRANPGQRPRLQAIYRADQGPCSSGVR